MGSIKEEKSPRWSHTTKLVLSLVMLVIFAYMIIKYKYIVAPLVFAFILAYLFYPIPEFLLKRFNISWRLTVLIIYLLVLALFIGIIALGGFAIVDQISSLIKLLQQGIAEIPAFLDSLSELRFEFAGFTISFAELNLEYLGNELMKLIQPVLAGMGNIVTSVAGGAAKGLGLILLSIVVSYFLLSETTGKRNELIKINIPGYSYDIQRMSAELKRIWNAFLRGQLTIILITIITYTILLGILGVKFYYGLAIIAGLARFIPYVGPIIAWTTYGLVALFQGTTLFGMEPIAYALLIVGISWFMDVILDNMVVPRLMGDALKVHPAAVMVAVIIFAGLFGFAGVLLAAPVFASALLIGRYIFYKMFDMDPWEKIPEERISATPVVPKQFRPFLKFIYHIRNKIKNIYKNKKKGIIESAENAAEGSSETKEKENG
jgi:predicted PurR-regulated permease PerM